MRPTAVKDGRRPGRPLTSREHTILRRRSCFMKQIGNHRRKSREIIDTVEEVADDKNQWICRLHYDINVLRTAHANGGAEDGKSIESIRRRCQGHCRYDLCDLGRFPYSETLYL